MRNSNYLRQAKRRQNRTTHEEALSYTPKDKVVGKASLANLMDVTITSVERWIRNGMPVEQRGDPLHDWIFDLTKVKNWHLAEKD